MLWHGGQTWHYSLPHFQGFSIIKKKKNPLSFRLFLIKIISVLNQISWNHNSYYFVTIYNLFYFSLNIIIIHIYGAHCDIWIHTYNVYNQTDFDINFTFRGKQNPSLHISTSLQSTAACWAKKDS